MSDVFEFEFIGKMPYIMHHDNIDGRDAVKEWLESDTGKELSKPGDDRTPAWTWQTYLYHDGEHIAVPADNLMSALLFGGTKTTLKGPKTYKDLSQSAIFIEDEYCKLLVGGKPVPMAAIEKVKDLKFSEQVNRVQKLGFQLYVKSVAIRHSGKTVKNVRVRPRFDEWSLRGRMQILDSLITEESLRKILENTGSRAGLGDRRPGVDGGKKPGPFGTFTYKLKRV